MEIIRETVIPPDNTLTLPFFWHGDLQLQQCGDVVGWEVLVFVRDPCRQAMEEHARRSPQHEIGGLLLGRYGIAGGQRFVIVEEVLPAPGVGSMVEFRFTAGAIQELDAEHNRRYTHLLRLGWYHSHPMGLRLSGTDLAIHRGIFRAPHQIAIVLQTGGHAIGCAVWHGKEVSPVGGFFVLEGMRS